MHIVSRQKKKNIVITGASGGLGSQVSSMLEDNYSVIAPSSKELDVRSYSACTAFFDTNDADILLNFAGINADKILHKITTSDIDSMNHLIDVNVRGAMNIAAAVLPGMRSRNYGRIIMISSILTQHTVPGTAIYSSTKAFIDQLVKNISTENISKGITANSIRCGYFQGGLTDRLPDPELAREQIALKRFGTATELTAAIEFMISTEYATGINLNLSGGL